MSIKWKKVGAITSIAAAWFGLFLGGWSAYQGQQDTKFNHAVKVKEQKTGSYVSAMEALKHQRKSKELEVLSNEYVNYEAAWRAEVDLSEIIQPMLDNKLNEIPPGDVERVKRALSKQVGNDHFHPSPIILGGAYFAINENEKAKEYLEYARSTGYDPPANAFLSVVYSRLSKATVDSNVRERLKLEALLSFKQEVDTSSWEKPPKKWLMTSDNAKDQTKKYLKFAFDNKELTEIVKGDPDSNKLVDMVLMSVKDGSEEDAVWVNSIDSALNK